MLLIKELMEVYSENLNLAFFLMDYNGDVLYEVQANKYAPQELKQDTVNEIIYISSNINNSTIYSVFNDLLKIEIFYIITPPFELDNRSFTVVSGPFIIKNDKSHQESPYLIMTDQQVELVLNKVNKLFHILSDRLSVINTQKITSEFSEILFSINDVNFEQLISKTLNVLLKFKEIDFIGIAVRDKTHVFNIEYIYGDNCAQLMKKKFYLGEGILGKAAIIGSVVNWSKVLEGNSIEFLNRYGLNPTNLIVLPVIEEKEVQMVIFGGNSSEKNIDIQFIKLLHQLINLNYHSDNSKNTKEISLVQNLFESWLDLLDIIQYSFDTRNIGYKILDFMQFLNKGNFACFTNMETEEFIYRGNLSSTIVEKHYTVLEDYSITNKIIVDNNIVHFFFLVEESYFGLCTVVFNQFIDNKKLEVIFRLLEKSLTIKFKKAVEIGPDFSYMCNLMLSTIKELDNDKYEKVLLSESLVKNLINDFEIPREKQLILLSMIKVYPFSFTYLETHLKNFSEWYILEDVRDCVEISLIPENASLEFQILVFIYEVFYTDRRENEWLLLNYKNKNIFLNTLDQFGLRSKSLKKQNNHSVKYIIDSLLLTAREKEILLLVLDGLNNQEISMYLKISVHTVKNHVTNILKKLNVSDRVQLIGKIYRLRDGEDF